MALWLGTSGLHVSFLHGIYDRIRGRLQGNDRQQAFFHLVFTGWGPAFERTEMFCMLAAEVSISNFLTW